MMRRVLIISPHFPPDSSAGTHRARIMAPRLAAHGWSPTILTCHPDSYEGALDDTLAAWVPPSVRVVRAAAWPARVTRRLGIGDLGLRSLSGLRREAKRLLSSEPFDLLFITIFPAYTALLGPWLAGRFSIPLVVDYQDPWISAWGQTVGGGRDGRADLKSRMSRALAEWLEPRVVRAADAITAVSAGTYDPILGRNPSIRPVTRSIPIGAEPDDFTAHDNAAAQLPFDPADGHLHVCCTGTILPLGVETLQAVLGAARLLRDRRPDLYGRLRLHFIGTSNQTTPTDQLRVVPLARELGVADVVREIPTRLPYTTIVSLQRNAGALLAMGSSEHHYTASKIFPVLLARRPVLAVYHERSSVSELLARASRPPSVNLVTYTDTARAETRREAIFECLAALVTQPVWQSSDVDTGVLDGYCADRISAQFAEVFDQVIARRAA
jgi:hypothetical protein